jgi:hypothetical protein
MTISKIRAMLRNVLDKHDNLLQPGEAMVLDALISRLHTYGDDISVETVKGVHAAVQLVSAATVGLQIWQDIDCAFQEWIDDKQVVPEVTVVARITVSANEAGSPNFASLLNLLYGIDHGAISGSVEVTIEEGCDD